MPKRAAAGTRTKQPWAVILVLTVVLGMISWALFERFAGDDWRPTNDGHGAAQSSPQASAQPQPGSSASDDSGAQDPTTRASSSQTEPLAGRGAGDETPILPNDQAVTLGQTLAGRWYRGDAALVTGLRRYVEASLLGGDLDAADFSTGHELFDGEWLYGTYMMASMGLGQRAYTHPNERESLRTAMERALQAGLSEAARAFDVMKWSEDPLDLTESQGDHAAYLGYLNLALSLYQTVYGGDTELAAVNDAISAFLRLRLESRGHNLLETYPGEFYPVDNCAVVASVMLNARVHGQPIDDAWGVWRERLDTQWRDAETGLLWQVYSPEADRPLDAPRGSGSALCAYFLSFADTATSADLYGAVVYELADVLPGVTMVREYPDGWEGNGDIDSGPIVFGYGVSATGFTLSGSRIHSDRAVFLGIANLAMTFGSFRDDGERAFFVGSGPLHNAIMFAMLTAIPAQ